MGIQRHWQPVALVCATLLAATGCDMGSGPSTAPAPGTPELPATSAPAADNPASPPPASETEAREVVAETLAYAEVGEQLVHGHFAFPADMIDPLPGIIVIHERWGLDDSTRVLAEQLASQGYIVLAVDLFGGQTTRDMSIARNLMVPIVEDPGPSEQNIRQAYQFLVNSAQSPRVGALGWSFGGSWALNSASLYPDDLAAAVIYYGGVTDNEERLAPINVPILGLFGETDRSITAETISGFEGTLERLDKDYQIEVYPGAGHAFADPEGTNYNADVAARAWAEVTAFLEKHLATD
jgi:carboxymethylenebutenolidase